jgi:hypothetical protein
MQHPFGYMPQCQMQHPMGYMTASSSSAPSAGNPGEGSSSASSAIPARAQSAPSAGSSRRGQCRQSSASERAHRTANVPVKLERVEEANVSVKLEAGRAEEADERQGRRPKQGGLRSKAAGRSPGPLPVAKRRPRSSPLPPAPPPPPLAPPPLSRNSSRHLRHCPPPHPPPGIQWSSRIKVEPGLPVQHPIAWRPVVDKHLHDDADILEEVPPAIPHYDVFASSDEEEPPNSYVDAAYATRHQVRNHIRPRGRFSFYYQITA